MRLFSVFHSVIITDTSSSVHEVNINACVATHYQDYTRILANAGTDTTCNVYLYILEINMLSIELAMPQLWVYVIFI